MTLVSELVLTRNQLLQLARSQENATFAVPLQRLSAITTDLQEGVMKTRMQPIGNAWNKLPRIVRDLARDLDKKIELVMNGAETELDRQVLELIKDPLTHMVRNCGDHGLETPAERRAAGKPETGAHHAERLSRGRPHHHRDLRRRPRTADGPDPRQGAVHRHGDRGRAGDDERAQLTRFIFRAGFSTAAAITAVSGRGVGMDVVKTNIETHRRLDRPENRGRARQHVHHQDPAHPGHRVGADRRIRRRAFRHPADQRGRAGARATRCRARQGARGRRQKP